MIILNRGLIPCTYVPLYVLQFVYRKNLCGTRYTHVTAATINQLRQAFQIQRLLEKDARKRGGLK